MSEEELIEEPKEIVVKNIADAMFIGDPCEPNLILNKLKQTRLWTDKKNIISEIINNCGKKVAKGKSKGKTKRAMSGWNCVLKQCTTTGMAFSECMQDQNVKKDYNNNKDKYKELARSGCK